MPLPQVDVPLFEVEIPTTKEKVNCRPFLVKEEKLLVMASESGSLDDMIKATQQIITNCSFGKIDGQTIPLFELQKIFLDLQQDEIEFTNESFKIIYEKIINEFQKNQKLILEVFLNSLNQDLANHVTGILMNEDQYELHDWLSKNIFVKHKDKVISQLVSETILSLRTFLINKKVEELKEETKDSLENNKILEEIGEYHKLKTILSKKLNRVL